MAYVVAKTTKNVSLPYLPMDIVLPKTQETIVLDRFKDSDYDGVYEILKEVIEEGQTYPQDKMEKEDFEQYYLSHDTFVARASTNGNVIGAFYVKPNFPGRSSHICNAGFLVHKNSRSKGIGEILVKNYKQIAKDLGYRASLFNLVFASNEASLRMCRRMGFKEVGRVPKAGNLKGLGYVDAVQFYFDFTLPEETKESV